ncbi:MAG: phytoene desaturase family protein [Anaerolineae bacterium]
MADRSLIVIGAGIAGLSAGCYAQMNGYRTRIFELHDKAGGLCTAWKRKGYTFDGCMHLLLGSGPGSSFYRIWQELGVVQDRQFIYHDEFSRVRSVDGRDLIIHSDLDRLEAHLLQMAPADADLVRSYICGARAYTRFEMVGALLGPSHLLKMLPHLGAMGKWSGITLQQMAERFSDPFMQQAWPWIHFTLATPVGPQLMNWGALAMRRGGWPVGGSLGVAQAIAQRFLALGGEVRYRSRVQEILVENDRAVGVRLENGEEYRADAVISAGDGHAMIYDMLGGRYRNEAIDRYYAATDSASPYAGIHVSLGVARDMSREPHDITYLLDRPVTIAGEARQRLTVENYAFDPTMAPAGKSALKVLLDSTQAYWAPLRAEGRERYNEEKRRVGEVVVEELDRLMPGIKAQVEVLDVATPFTTERYTGNWRGVQAWWPSEANAIKVMMNGFTRTLPGLAGFYMAGQWSMGMPGLNTAAASARQVVRALCKHEGRRFVARIE